MTRDTITSMPVVERPKIKPQPRDIELLPRSLRVAAHDAATTSMLTSTAAKKLQRNESKNSKPRNTSRNEHAASTRPSILHITKQAFALLRDEGHLAAYTHSHGPT